MRPLNLFLKTKSLLIIAMLVMAQYLSSDPSFFDRAPRPGKETIVPNPAHLFNCQECLCQLIAAGFGKVAPLTHVIFVDGGTQTEVSQQDGSISCPYSTIQSAIDSIPAATSANELRQVYYILIASGTYDEDLVIDGTRKKIALLGLGPVNLGIMNGPSWTPGGPGGTIRNITWFTSTLDNFGTGIRNALIITSLDQFGEGITTHESYISKFRVSGDINCSNISASGSAELQFSVEVFGDLNTPTDIFQVYLYKSRIRGVFSGGPSTNFQVAEFCRFQGLVTVGRYSHIISCNFNNGMTVSTASSPGDVSPRGMMLSQFAGTFTGPPSSFLLDTVTNYWFVTLGGVLAGGATKVLLFDTTP